MNKVQMYEFVASIFTKINNSKTLTAEDSGYIKFAVVSICEKGNVKYEDLIQFIEFVPHLSAVIMQLTGDRLVKLSHKREISLYEMLFFLDCDGVII